MASVGSAWSAIQRPPIVWLGAPESFQPPREPFHAEWPLRESGGEPTAGGIYMRMSSLMLVAMALQVPATQDLAAIRTINAETPQAVQIALAKAAGPPVSADATIYVLG